MLLNKYRRTVVLQCMLEVFSVACVRVSTATQVLRGVSCVAYKTCLTSQLLLSASVFIYLKEYSITEQSLAYPSEKSVETVCTAVTPMEYMMAEIGHLSSVEQCIKAAIKNSIDFKWMWCKRANRLKSETVRQWSTKRKMQILQYQYVIRKVILLHFCLATSCLSLSRYSSLAD
jgi:hypothetical protein